MTAEITGALVGHPKDRVDGPSKVAGVAAYPSDVALPGQTHAVLVRSAIAAGRIRLIDTAEAEAAPGVLAVLTHKNAPPLEIPPDTGLGPAPRFPLRDDRILHHGQHVALVVAETWEQAMAASRLVDVRYEPATPLVDIDDPDVEIVTDPWSLEEHHGDVPAALATAEVVYDGTFTIPAETNNPMGPFSTVAEWRDGRLVVHDSNQWPMMARRVLAAAFGLPETDVRVLTRYLGGGFGAGLRTWPHTILAALAARIVNRPVRLVLTRPQMFTSMGHRAESVQRLRVGATNSGRLLAIDHDATSTVGVEEQHLSLIVAGTGEMYDCPNVATHDRQVRLNIPNPGFMRAPGHAEASFAIESALDELSYRLGLDPIELRKRNHAAVHPPSSLPWSSNALRECYDVGAERFGWRHRAPEPRSMRDGDQLVGYGMAGVTFSPYGQPCRARVSVAVDGTALVRGASTDLGTGTATIAAQTAAELLGLRMSRVRVDIGDSDLPPAPQAGGSGLAAVFTGAIQAAAGNVRQAFLRTIADDDRSPLRGRSFAEVAASDGRLHLVDDPTVGETYAEILARHGMEEIAEEGEVVPGASTTDQGTAKAGAFAAQFAEVRVDEVLGVVRVARFVSVVDGGRILNRKLARSQIVGGVVQGIGMALLEDTAYDPGVGRIANATFGDYLVPVNADVPDIDVTFVGEPDQARPTGVKGIGEIGLVGVAPAIANAVHHATGRRIRSLPITIDQLL